MFLSKIEIDINRTGARLAVASPQILHAAVEGCFPDKPDKEDRDAAEKKDRKLWRLEKAAKGYFLLLLSPEKPDFTHFAGQFCQRGVTGQSKDYAALLAKIQEGQHWHFRLKGNATHSVVTEKGGRGKIYAHESTGHQRAWLLKKSDRCGFALQEGEYEVVERDLMRFTRNRKEEPVELGVAVFEGSLTVTDAALFRQALVQGIGRAKAYGCGLLTVARPL